MGRPVTGVLKFSDKTLAVLPEYGTVIEFARILGMSVSGLRAWIQHDGAPCADRLNQGRVLRRDDFTSWAKKTGRYRQDIVLDYTNRVKKLSPEAQEFLQRWSTAVNLSSVFVFEFLNVLEVERKRF